jgi:hypothetical protein
VVTLTSTSPAYCAGVVAVICVALLTVKLAAGTPPKRTWLAEVKFVPVMVMLVPPAVVPEVVPRLVMAGAAVAR